MVPREPLIWLCMPDVPLLAVPPMPGHEAGGTALLPRRHSQCAAATLLGVGSRPTILFHLQYPLPDNSRLADGTLLREFLEDAQLRRYLLVVLK